MLVTGSSDYLSYCTPSTTNVMKVRLDVYILVFSPFHSGNKVDDRVNNRDRSLSFLVRHVDYLHGQLPMTYRY